METYWITGVQLGILLAFAKDSKEAKELVDEIIRRQQTQDAVRKIK